MKATERVQFVEFGLPVWINYMHYRLSKTGQSVVVEVRGNVDQDSHMQGGWKRCYIPFEKFHNDPVGAINNFLHSCKYVRLRYYGSKLVHTAWRELSMNEREELQDQLKAKNLDIYKDEEAQRIVEKYLEAKEIKVPSFIAENFLPVKELRLEKGKTYKGIVK